MKLLLAAVSLIMMAAPALAVGQDRMWDAEPTFDETCMSTDPCTISDMAEVPCMYSSSGWFAGVGGSFNSVKVESTTSGIGRTRIYSGPTLVAVGTAGGPAAPFEETATTFAPLAQVGYMQSVRDSDWIWGAKFSYKYLGLTLSDDGFDAPQVGVYEIFSPPSTSTFTGNAVTDSAQTLVNHELALFPFLGRSFGKGRFYAGGGPVVYST